jgi:hypothetical protein
MGCAVLRAYINKMPYLLGFINLREYLNVRLCQLTSASGRIDSSA